jgi:hypothetical protein
LNGLRPFAATAVNAARTAYVTLGRVAPSSL